MGFFDDIGEISPPPTEPQQQTTWPARQGPPEGWVLPTVLPIVRKLGSSANAQLALAGVLCWPEGVTLTIRVMRRRAAAVTSRDEWGFRFGALFSDGRRAVALPYPHRAKLAPTPRAEPGEGPLLRQTGLGGTQFHRRAEYYLWPLPPQGRLTLVTDWPGEGVSENWTELDAGEIRAAANRAMVVWSDLAEADTGTPRGSFGTRVSGSTAF